MRTTQIWDWVGACVGGPFWAAGRRRSTRARALLNAVGTLGLLTGPAGCGATFTDLSKALPPATDIADSFTGAAGQVASGTFSGRGSYSGAGGASLHLNDNGSFELRFAADFSTSDIPGPVVLLTNRDSITGGIKPEEGDLHLGTLTSFTGAQTYTLPGGDGGRRYAWVYCEPFSVEVAVALLEAP